jgi:hypothetical protein
VREPILLVAGLGGGTLSTGCSPPHCHCLQAIAKVGCVLTSVAQAVDPNSLSSCLERTNSHELAHLGFDEKGGHGTQLSGGREGVAADGLVPGLDSCPHLLSHARRSAPRLAPPPTADEVPSPRARLALAACGDAGAPDERAATGQARRAHHLRAQGRDGEQGEHTARQGNTCTSPARCLRSQPIRRTALELRDDLSAAVGGDTCRC